MSCGHDVLCVEVFVARDGAVVTMMAGRLAPIQPPQQQQQQQRDDTQTNLERHTATGPLDPSTLDRYIPLRRER
jgi:hypothetical protein